MLNLRLKPDAFYVGAIGSRHHSGLRKTRLHEHFDLPQEALQRLVAAGKDRVDQPGREVFTAPICAV